MISLVVPCYNEITVLRQTHTALAAAAIRWGEPAEIVFVDDGSTDGTWGLICELAAADPRVGGVRLSRNFGQQRAIGAGLERARGDAVIVLDADLQDPPELIAEMLNAWRSGHDVVIAQRQRRLGESWVRRTLTNGFYALLTRLAAIPLLRDAGDFALLDARVVRAMLDCPEQAVFWRGLRGWTGFRQTVVQFDRPPRAAGKSKYTWRKLLRLAGDGLLSFSPLPLRLPLYLGLIALAAAGSAALTSLFAFLLGATSWQISAWPLVLLFFGGVQLLSLGVIGEYLNRIYDEVRRRPRWIVADVIGAAATQTVPIVPIGRSAAQRA